MPFSWDEYPYTNFHELNLDWFINKFKEIFDEWDALYAEMNNWKTETEAGLAEWKTDTEQDISDWEDGVISDLNDWKDDFETLFDSTFDNLSQIKEDAEDARDLAQGYANDASGYADAASASATSISESATQINTNTDSIAELKEEVENITGVHIVNTWTSGGYFETEEAATTIDITQPTSSANYVYLVYPCTEGDVFHITSTGANHARNWAFIDSSGNILSRSAKNDYDMEDVKIIAPADSANAVFNARAAQTYYMVAGESMPDIVTAIYNEFNTNTQIYKGVTNPTEYSNLLSHITSPGTYYIKFANSDTYNDRPENAPSNSAGILTVQKYGSALVYQTYYGGKGHILRRLINISTHAPYTTGIVCDANGWFVQTEIQNLYKLITAFRWNGKRIVCFGDSRTWYDGKSYTSTTKTAWRGQTCIGYQQQIKNLCGATVISQGVSGDTSIDICDRIRQYDFSSADAVFLQGGVNDFIRADQVTIGSIAAIGATFDTDTVYGAWQSAIEYILTNYPYVKIYIDIPAIAWADTPEEVFPYNTAKIKGEIAELYNIPCLDLYKNGSINVINRDYYYADDTTLTNNWHLHFNDYGNALIGAIIAEFINTH